MRLAIIPFVALVFTAITTGARAGDGNRLAYLDENAPYYVGRDFPKLVTPQWVGEPGVEAVVILAIDDMRDPAKYETVLRPILERLKKIDGRAPVSIMTCKVDPADPRLQGWLKEGLSLEAHTIDHPCPLLANGDFAKAKSTYDQCIDLLNAIPGNRPVAFRMPCCDSLNTPSPRFFAEIFNKTTAKGGFLQIDSSVFNIPTPNDPALPRDLVIDEKGGERFRRYLPFSSFVNTIEDYPYPYVINRLCWEFPCAVPSDWEAQNVQKSANPRTLEDWKRNIDATVIKQGVFTMVFHPYGWSKPEQIAELVDYADRTYGKRVKFLTFAEALERLNKNLLGGQPLRNTKGEDNGVRLLDVNNDGFMDVLIGNEGIPEEFRSRIWSPQAKEWRISGFGGQFVPKQISGGTVFGIGGPDRLPIVIVSNVDLKKPNGAWRFNGELWVEDSRLMAGAGDGARLRDVDGDGRCELLVADPTHHAALRWDPEGWFQLPFVPFQDVMFADENGRDGGLRLVDIDGDGFLDLLFSNQDRYSLRLFTDMKDGWTKKQLINERRDATHQAIPMIARDGTDNGAFFHSRHLWVQNEDTAKMPDLVDRRSFNELLKGAGQPGPRSPLASLKSIRVRPGFQVEQVATEPLVQDPILFDWGADGKLWVVEMGDYPLGADGKGEPGGRVKYLEDTDGDGKYDKATLFLDHLGYPTGIFPWRKGVLVIAAPDLFYAEDTDGDGKADKREVLFTGFVRGNPQHLANGLTYGLDNWLYGANGHSGGTVKSLKTGAAIDIGGRDFRIRPDTGEIETASGPTQFGRAKDDWGDWFGNENSNPMYLFALEDHYLRRNPHVPAPNVRVPVSEVPGTAPVYPISRTLERFNDFWALNRFTSANSAIIYRDDLFGPAFANNTFVSEPVHNLIHREVMRPEGLVFKSHRPDDEQTSEFLASTDNWFRPTTLRTGPDGALWVADMYRHVIEHPQWIPKEWQERLDLRAGHDMGRMYRVYPVGTKPRPIPQLDKLDTAGLVAALDSPNGWQRDTAQRLLLTQVDPSDIPATVPLLEKLATTSARPLARLHALCTLGGLKLYGRPALKPELLRQALADEHPGVRRHAVRLCEGRLDGQPELGKALLARYDDPDPHVRLQLACTLGEWGDYTADLTLGKIAFDAAANPFLRAAALSSMGNLNAVMEGMQERARATGKPAPPALYSDLLRTASARAGDGPWAWVGPASLIQGITKPARAVPVGYEPWQMDAMADFLQGGVGRTLLKRLEEQAKHAEQDPLEERYELAASAVRGIDAMLESARYRATHSMTQESERLPAIRLLGSGRSGQREDAERLASLLSPKFDDAAQATAAATLGRLQLKEAPSLLLAGWKGYGPHLRAAVLDALLSRDDSVRALLDAVEAKKVLPSEIDAERRQRLLRHKTVAIRERATQLLADTVQPDRQKVIDAFKRAATLDGKPAHGAELFAKLCSTCHRLNGVGNEVGPDLAALKDKSPEYLMLQILDPNRAVEAKYTNYVVETGDGRTLSGILTNETGSSVTLLGADGKPQPIVRSELKSLRSTGTSLMPEGLETGLTPEDLADLIAHVRGTDPPAERKTFPDNKPEVVAPQGDMSGSLRLTPANAEIYGPSLVLEAKYGNLGFWSDEQDRAVWTIQPARAGRYTVWLEYACDPAAAGNKYVLWAGPGQLSGAVEGTGNWDTYKRFKAGEVTLDAAAKQRITLRSAGRINGALMDLRAVELVPQ